jgi:acetyl esterase/lipase
MSAPAANEIFDIEIISDVPYGEGSIGFGSDHPSSRALTLDIYRPRNADANTLKPALILSHGGAYHRGSKTHDDFEQDGHHTTPVTEYCKIFAARGYVCFSVGYRLTQELAAPQAEPIKRNRQKISRGRIDHVREIMGLAPATDAELLNGIEGAFVDVANAFKFVQSHAGQWGIDPQRIAVGGFSAGAFASIYASFALGINAAAIISLSGGIDIEDADYYVHGGRGQPPLLMFSSEFDLPGIHDRTMNMADKAQAKGIGIRRYFVPQKPHFYDRHSVALLAQNNLDGAIEKTTVGMALIDFLEQTLAPPKVTEKTLIAFSQAWNNHDIHALMSFMSEECVFHTFSGNESCGTSQVGKDNVRSAFMKAWQDYPDAQWTRARHFVAGQRGVSEWTFTGTRKSDGVRIEVDGCDIFTFEGSKIKVKDSWRKHRI